MMVMLHMRGIPKPLNLQQRNTNKGEYENRPSLSNRGSRGKK
jgi:hypothetical protein